MVLRQLLRKKKKPLGFQFLAYSKKKKKIKILLINKFRVRKPQTQIEENIGDRSQDSKGLLRHKSKERIRSRKINDK